MNSAFNSFCMFRSSKPKQQDSPEEEEEEDEEAVEIHVQNDLVEDSDKQKKKKKKTRKYLHISLTCWGFSFMSFAPLLLDFKQKISWRIGLHQR